MRQLAEDHGQAGWHAHAFPVSVDGVEIVASLILLADRRAGRRSGWLPWAALAVGTAGSLAANVATAHSDPVSGIIAGWPAVALLIAVKLLSGLIDRTEPDSTATTESPQPNVGQGNDRDRGESKVVSSPKPGVSHQAKSSQRVPTVTAELAPGIAAVLSAAHAAANELCRDGQSLTRDALAARMRMHGHPVRNASLTPLLSHLRGEATGQTSSAT